ncbi:hypothetical protein K469DRAFT_681999 [Zopfia rhizophila CBS 207.26]|uniref:Uncharacterized protein n=1 Tax=Zopfia rhizophila CBS 207.26 TaxID=1314779 RepID=A0A6A6EWZ2_9PEZI|nr:hypothetical protein K469DRAFT_681999 [Zopfia rhizophila CBS 207.26]
MNPSQNSNDSLTTIEDNTLYQGEVSAKDVKSQSASGSAGPDSSALPQSFPVSQGSPHADSRGKKRPHEEDSDDERPIVGGKVPRTGKRSILTTDGLLQANLVVESMKTLTKRNNDLEARVEALEDAHVRLLDSFKEWAEETEKFQRDDPKKWLTWHGQYLTEKNLAKAQFLSRAQTITINSGIYKNTEQAS